MTYPIKDFLGFSPPKLQSDNKQLLQITMYLAPGDYHCFHSPLDWTVEQRRHIKGKLLSVRPSVATWMPNLFAQNERVVYSGRNAKDSGFFTFAAVGATNVGSIMIDIDEELITNCKDSPFNECKTKEMVDKPHVSKGAYFGKLRHAFFHKICNITNLDEQYHLF